MKTLKIHARWISYSFALFLGLLLGGASPLQGVTIQVNAARDNLQAVINAADSGDVLELSRGTFTGNFTIVGKSLTLKGQGMDRAQNNRNFTALDGDFNGTVLTISGEVGNSPTVILKDLIIEQGSAGAVNRVPTNRGFGGGILNNTANLELENVRMINNQALLGAGGAIASINGDVTIQDSILRLNFAFTGGAINFFNGKLKIKDSKISANGAVTGGGGGVVTNDSDNRITNTSIIRNSAVLGGGGLLNGSGSTTEIKNCEINENTASFGGGIYNAGAALTIFNSKINDNESKTLPCLTPPPNPPINLLAIRGGKGGGIFNDNPGIVSLIDSTVTGNDALLLGGGIFNLGGTINISGDTRIADNFPNDISP